MSTDTDTGRPSDRCPPASLSAAEGLRARTAPRPRARTAKADSEGINEPRSGGKAQPRTVPAAGAAPRPTARSPIATGVCARVRVQPEDTEIPPPPQHPPEGGTIRGGGGGAAGAAHVVPRGRCWEEPQRAGTGGEGAQPGGTPPGGAPRGTLPPAASGPPAPASGVMAPAPATAEPSASSGTSSSMTDTDTDAAAKGAGRARQAPAAAAAAELLPAPAAAAAEEPGNGGDHRAREAPRPDTPRRLRAEVGRGHSRKWGRPLPPELIYLGV